MSEYVNPMLELVSEISRECIDSGAKAGEGTTVTLAAHEKRGVHSDQTLWVHTKIGKVIIGSHVSIGAYTKIGNRFSEHTVEIGNDCIIGEGVSIAPEVKTGDRVRFEDGSSMGHVGTVGNDVRVGMGVRIGDCVDIGNGVVLGDDSFISDRANVGDSTIVGIDSRVRYGALVPAGTNIPEAHTFVSGRIMPNAA